jgi:glycine/D-amino acid oxidase-like deaminating enzyme
MRRETPRVVICGGGVIGAAIAYHLGLRGIGATVIERAEIAAAASGKSGGFLALDWCDGSPLGPLARESFRMHAELATRLGVDYGYRTLTTLGVAASAFSGIRRDDTGSASPWLDGECLVYSRLGGPETTAQVHPRLFTRALMDEACRHGAEIVIGCVDGIETSGAPIRVHGVRVDGHVVAADAVVVAMGPWTSLASSWLPLPPVDGLKGFSVCLQPAAPVPAEALFVEYLEESGARVSPEIYPRPDGEVYVCGLSDDQPLPEDPRGVLTHSEASARLQRMAATLSSHMKQSQVVAENACYRPICADGLPLLGSVPGVGGAYVATGHSCWGILNAPASGAAMAELIVDGESKCVDIRPFMPARLMSASRQSHPQWGTGS